jgi:hypothetical protein
MPEKIENLELDPEKVRNMDDVDAPHEADNMYELLKKVKGVKKQKVEKIEDGQVA